MKRHDGIIQSYRLFFIIVLAIVFLAEIVAMYALSRLPYHINEYYHSILDASIMVAISAPIIWLLTKKRYHAETALLKNEALLTLQINRMPIGCIFWDTDFRIFSWNPAAEGIFGFKASEAIGKHPYDIIVPREAQPQVDIIWKRLLEGDTTAHIVNENIAKDGRTIICSWSNTPLKENGAVIGVLSMVQDITERRRAEAALRESEERFRLMVENVKDYAIFMLSPEGNVVSWNAGAERIKGYKAEEILGKHFTCFYPAEDIKNGKPEQQLEIAANEGRVEDEGWRIRKDGSRLWGNVVITALRDEHGELRGFTKVTRDITERIRMEEALKESEKNYRTLVDNAVVGVFKTSLKGEFVYANAALSRMLGFESPEELMSKNVQNIYKNLEDRKLLLENFKKNGKVELFETEVITKSGDTKNVLFNATLEGDVLSGMVIDITERKRAEEEIKRYTEDLKRSNEELQQFAYIASHDLQEPLRMISSYLQLIERRYKGRLDKDADEFIAYAVDGASRLQSMINGLLAYSRVGTRSNPFEPTDFKVILEQALANLKVAIEESGAVITHDPLPTVTVDASQLVMVLQNLISNAIKFRGKEPPGIHISAERKDNEWLFSVRDNGMGIDPEYIDRIFVIFRRLHGREYPGTGIGLAICKRIVERHGGRIWVESEPEKGSTFYFTIPIKGDEK